ncbi:MAG: phosphoribosylglycinamide formyltransferase [Xanthomonadales bacterium]|nr:phosphoribosylglycinamide formyltransferase [Xanthomonadales bacterium]
MNPGRLRTAVLISGTGSNLRTLIDAVSEGRLGLDIVQVISNRATAPGLQHARDAGIAHTLVESRDRARQDRALLAALDSCRAELVVLAGFMSILGPEPVNAYSGRMINLHPSLLPLYPGLDTYRRALAAGDAEHGASIHFVTTDLDAGPVIAQVRIPILEGDTPQSLAARLGPREHQLLRATVELFTQRRVELHGADVLLDGHRIPQPLQLNDRDRFD